jgi:hypothetical protein
MTAALFCSLIFTAFAMAGSLAHVFELPNKITLSAEHYLVVQQIYRGWSLLGIVVFGALISTLVLTVMARRSPKLFRLALAAFLALVGTQIIFWIFTYPANQQTQNWTILPENWIALRSRWEYSHAAGACLNLVAFITLVSASLARSRGRVAAPYVGNHISES